MRRLKIIIISVSSRRRLGSASPGSEILKPFHSIFPQLLPIPLTTFKIPRREAGGSIGMGSRQRSAGGQGSYPVMFRLISHVQRCTCWQKLWDQRPSTRTSAQSSLPPCSCPLQLSSQATFQFLGRKDRDQALTTPTAAILTPRIRKAQPWRIQEAEAAALEVGSLKGRGLGNLVPKNIRGKSSGGHPQAKLGQGEGTYL